MKKLRKGIDFIGVTCVFYCHDGKGNFLLHQRSENCKDEQGRWDCGGGGLEVGEEFEDGVKREIMEEYGCDFGFKVCRSIKCIEEKSREYSDTLDCVTFCSLD